MNGNQVDALARIKGIKVKLAEASDEFADDGNLSLGMTAKKLEGLLEVVCDSIDGDLSDRADDEVAKSLVVSFGIVNALTGIIGL